MNLDEVIKKENENIERGRMKSPPHTKVGSLQKIQRRLRSSMDPKKNLSTYYLAKT